MEKEKDQSIETLRGIAILLVVAGYITRTDILPLDLTHPSLTVSILKYLEHTLATIRMPLFTVISAYLYGASPAVRETFQKLVFGKFRRIMIPFLIFSTVQFLLFTFFAPEPEYGLNHLWKIYIWPNQQLWFLMSVFEIFIIVGILDSFKALETPKRYFTVCLIAALVHVSIRFPGAFSAYGVNYLFPFFLLGYGIRRYGDIFLSKRWLPTLAVIFLISVCIQPIYYAVTKITGDPPFHFRRIVDLIVPFSGFPLMFRYRKTVPLLAFFGYYAFGIHLFHRVSVTAVRLIFQAYHIQDPLQIFFGYLIGGVLIALFIQVFCEQFVLTSKLVLGLKKKPEKTLIATIFRPVRLTPKPVNLPGLEPAAQTIPAESSLTQP